MAQQQMMQAEAMAQAHKAAEEAAQGNGNGKAAVKDAEQEEAQVSEEGLDAGDSESFPCRLPAEMLTGSCPPSLAFFLVCAVPLQSMSLCSRYVLIFSPSPSPWP